ncbi:MAG: hypothetical protein UZ14_CFX002001477 [Chloroflexi bacterium OLB14]|nr:MAG: hypothetical protein UZ14_CFX002001477 [Chloroflexi bacterium OLB14]
MELITAKFVMYMSLANLYCESITGLLGDISFCDKNRYSMYKKGVAICLFLQ